MALVVPFDDDQKWLKCVNTIIYIKFVALDGHYYPFTFL
jgi:hypothetical protein